VISRVAYRKQRGRRPLAALAVVTLITGLFVASGTVLAVHDEDFQLDGDVSSVPAPASLPVDWDSIFDANGATKVPLPTNFSDAALTQDFGHSTPTDGTFITSDQTTYATGSKDTLPISGWQCNYDNNVNSKIDVMNAYAAAYQVGTGDEFMYFGLERNTNTGTADVGFWFLQDDVNCASTGGAVSFTGQHLDGDVLIVSEFTSGGKVSEINVYRWDRPGNPPGVPGSLRTTPIGSGKDCRDLLLLPADPACAAANTLANGDGGTITTPWLTANFKDKVGHSLRTSEFFEGGINLTDLNLGGKCFNTFIGDTRSSTSLTATLFDFARGQAGTCTSTTVTAPKYNDTGNSYVNIPAEGISIGANARVNVRDSALLTVDGVDSYAGNVTFSLCGPLALESTTNCQTGGVQIGNPVDVAGTSPETVLGPITTLTSAGRYCWRADYSGDATAGVPASSDPSDSTSVTECFKVNPVQPTLTTLATTGPVDFGQVISDNVYLSGTAKQPGTNGVGPGGTINADAATQLAAAGTIRVTAYGPGCSTLALAEATTTASGDKVDPLFYFGPNSATQFQPASPGQYTFVASYDGNNPNTLGVAATACGSQPTSEQVVVRTIPTQIATTPSYFPQDSATVTSSLLGDNLPANGTVAFSLYGATTDPAGTAHANCQAGLATGRVYGPIPILTGEAAHSVTVGTDNQTFRVSAFGTFYWLVTYAPGDTAHTGIQSNCVENINATLTGSTGTGTIFPTP